MMHSITVYADHLLDIKKYVFAFSPMSNLFQWVLWSNSTSCGPYNITKLEIIIDTLQWFIISKRWYLPCEKRILRLRWHDLWWRVFQGIPSYPRVFQNRKKNFEALVEVQLLSSSIIFAFRNRILHHVFHHISWPWSQVKQVSLNRRSLEFIDLQVSRACMMFHDQVSFHLTILGVMFNHIDLE